MRAAASSLLLLALVASSLCLGAAAPCTTYKTNEAGTCIPYEHNGPRCCGNAQPLRSIQGCAASDLCCPEDWLDIDDALRGGTIKCPYPAMGKAAESTRAPVTPRGESTMGMPETKPSMKPLPTGSCVVRGKIGRCSATLDCPRPTNIFYRDSDSRTVGMQCTDSAKPVCCMPTDTKSQYEEYDEAARREAAEEEKEVLVCEIGGGSGSSSPRFALADPAAKKSGGQNCHYVTQASLKAAGIAPTAAPPGPDGKKPTFKNPKLAAIHSASRKAKASRKMKADNKKKAKSSNAKAAKAAKAKKPAKKTKATKAAKGAKATKGPKKTTKKASSKTSAARKSVKAKAAAGRKARAKAVKAAKPKRATAKATKAKAAPKAKRATKAKAAKKAPKAAKAAKAPKAKAPKAPKAPKAAKAPKKA